MAREVLVLVVGERLYLDGEVVYRNGTRVITLKRKPINVAGPGEEGSGGAHHRELRQRLAVALGTWRRAETALPVVAAWLAEQSSMCAGYAMSTYREGSREREDELYAAKRIRDFADHLERTGG